MLRFQTWISKLKLAFLNLHFQTCTCYSNLLFQTFTSQSDISHCDKHCNTAKHDTCVDLKWYTVGNMRLESITEWWKRLRNTCNRDMRWPPFRFHVVLWTQTEEQKQGRPGNKASTLVLVQLISTESSGTSLVLHSVLTLLIRANFEQVLQR